MTQFKLKSSGSALALFALSVVWPQHLNAGTIDIFGLPNTSLGSATLTAVGGTLVVSNIGPSGTDGVSVGLPTNTTSFDSVIANLGSASSTPTGSFVTLTGMGTVNAIPNQLISTTTATDLGSSLDLEYTSPVTSGGLFVQYYLDGNFFASEITPATSIFTGILKWPSDLNLSLQFFCLPGCVPPPSPPPPPCPWWFFVCWDSPVTITTPDNEVLPVDSIEITPTALSGTVGGFSSASLTAGGGISSLTILSEQVQTTPEPSSLFLLGSGLAALATLTARRHHRKAAQP